MRETLITLVKITFLMIVVIIFLFLFVDCKMENEKLKLKNFLLTEQVTELTAERDIIRNVYSRAFLRLLDDSRVSQEDLPVLLPEKEVKYLRVRQEEILNDPNGSTREIGSQE